MQSQGPSWVLSAVKTNFPITAPLLHPLPHSYLASAVFGTMLETYITLSKDPNLNPHLRPKLYPGPHSPSFYPAIDSHQRCDHITCQLRSLLRCDHITKVTAVLHLQSRDFLPSCCTPGFHHSTHANAIHEPSPY